MGQVKIQTVKLHVIPQSNKFQIRTGGTDREHIRQRANDYRAWLEARADDPSLPCPIPPPVLFKIGAVYDPTSGFHRIAAMREAGIEEAEFEVRVGFSEADAWVHAATANLDNYSLPLDRESIKESFLRFYDNSTAAKTMTDTDLGKMYHKDRTTIREWLRDHDEARRSLAKRTTADGKVLTVRGQECPADPDLFAEADGTRGIPVPASSDAADADGSPDPVEPVAVQPKSKAAAQTDPKAGRKADEYPPDERFMPNAAGAEKISVLFASVKSRMEAIKAEMKRLLPDPKHPIANRLHLHTTFLPNIGAMIEDLVNNTPTHTCPKCAGQTDVGGEPCKPCNGYGLVSAGDADQLKGAWKKGSGDLYHKLLKGADLAEVEA